MCKPRPELFRRWIPASSSIGMSLSVLPDFPVDFWKHGKEYVVVLRHGPRTLRYLKPLRFGESGFVFSQFLHTIGMPTSSRFVFQHAVKCCLEVRRILSSSPFGFRSWTRTTELPSIYNVAKDPPEEAIGIVDGVSRLPSILHCFNGHFQTCKPLRRAFERISVETASYERFGIRCSAGSKIR